MYKDPRSIAYRKPRKFYGTPFNKFINAAIVISSGIAFVIIYDFSHIPIVQRFVNKYRFVPKRNIIGYNNIEWNLEEKLRERLKIREHIIKDLQENKEVLKDSSTKS